MSTAQQAILILEALGEDSPTWDQVFSVMAEIEMNILTTKLEML